MKTLFSNGKNSDSGFIYVASRDKLYYELSLISATTLRDFFPQANITLFTHELFVDSRAEAIFDQIIVEIPVHYRAKIWCMSHTPYYNTIYIDCDSIIKHRDIKNMHGFLDDCDMFFGTTLWYTVGNQKLAYIDIKRTTKPKYHGSMVGYKKSDLTMDFMRTWFDKYIEQICNPWPYGDFAHKDWQLFDMFTLWRLTSGKYDEFKRFNDLHIKLLERRYNTTGQDLPEEHNGRPVIVQIDKGTWKKMPHAWAAIQKGIDNEADTLKKLPIKSPVRQYN